MTLFEWDPSLETGDRDIDEQHRTLFRLADELNSVCTLDCDDHERIADAMYELADYVVEHFSDEEQFMQRAGYPQIGPHRSLHRHLTAQALHYVASYMNGDEISGPELARFMAEWLRGHILVEDMRMVRFAREQ